MSRAANRIRHETKVAARAPFFVAEVVSIDTGTGTITVQEPGDLAVVLPATLGAYPAVGSTVLVMMNGDEPIVVGALGTGGGMLSSIPTGIPSVDDLTGVTPTTFQPPSTVLFLETDQKLYRWDGAAWTASVPAVDIDGTITETQIADDAITTPKIAANAVTAAEIAADAVTANELAAGAVTTDKLDAGAVTAAKIAAGTITAHQLAAIVLEVGQYIESTTYTPGAAGWHIDQDGNVEFNDGTFRGTLAAGVVSASAVQASSIGKATHDTGARALEAYDPALLSNNLANGTFDSNVTGWTGTNCTLTRQTSPTPQSGAGIMRLSSSAAGDMSATSPTGTSGVAGIVPGAQYKVTGYFRTAASARSCQIKVLFYNSAGTLLTTWASGAEGMVSTITDASGSWTQATAYATAPPAAAYAAVRLTVRSTTAASELHYVDTIVFTGQRYNGFCPDLDPLGVYTVDEAVMTFPVGLRATGSATGCPVTAVLFDSLVTADTAYSFVIAGAVSGSATGYRARIGVAWYTSAGALIRVDRSAHHHLLTTTPADLEDAFISPTGAVSAWVGVFAEPGGPASPLAGYVEVAEFYVYETTRVTDAVADEQVQYPFGKLPPGALMPYAGTIAAAAEPIAGWLICAGQAVSRTTYRALFAAIGDTYGAGDGSTTFNVPDLRGRVIVALDNQGGTDAGRLSVANTLGGTGGEQTHALTQSEIPGNVVVANSGGGTFAGPGATNLNQAGTTGSTPAHNNMQPYILMNYLIKC